MDPIKEIPLISIKWVDEETRLFTKEEINKMAGSIMSHGLLQPIICEPLENEKYRGVCGHLRYLGTVKRWSTPTGHNILARIHKFDSESDRKAWQLAENLHRKELSALEKAEWFKKYYNLLEGDFDKSYGESIVKTMARDLEDYSGEKVSESTIYEYIQIAEELPKEVKMKIPTGRKFGLRHARELLRLTDKPKEQVQLAEKFAEKPMTVQKLRREISKILAPEPEPLPEGEFNVILADPPWIYDKTAPRGDAQKHYLVMELEDIKNLKVPSAKDAVLFLWSTNPKLEEALEVVNAWGFKYRTNMVWVKDRYRVGFYARGQHELLLIARKGKMEIPDESDRPSSVLHTPRRGRGEKPEIIYSVIESMYPNGKYLELFTEKKRDGWEPWGNT